LPRPKGVKNEGHEARRRELLVRMLPRFIRRDIERPSLRQLAVAANVSVPTLRHYFGGRPEVVAALLSEYRCRGEARLQLASQPAGGFEASMREFAHAFVRGMQAPGEVRLGDMFAASLAEGLLDRQLSPMVLQTMLDPALEALEVRLKQHVAEDQMRPSDTRAAALMLLSPLLIAVLHQDQFGGRASDALDLPRLAEEIASAFVRAYRP
jgi:AcrR family transcriptional regulator